MVEPGSSPEAVAAQQLAALRDLLREIGAGNRFYQRKFAGIESASRPGSLTEFAAVCPFTTKAELVADQAANPPYGSNLTYPLARYTRCHQTSGTTGSPLRWLDTAESWSGMTDDWVRVFWAAGVTASDRILFAFSFGPFLGFWLAFEAGQRLGALCFAGGGMSSDVRLRLLRENECTVLCCTPTYALHLAEVARREGFRPEEFRVHTLVVAGEPGGSQPALRRRLSEAWHGARIFDHHGMTETGPVTHEDPEAPGNLRILTGSFFAEIIHPHSGAAVAPGEEGELVLTTLRRWGSPLIRYRTGDLVRGAAEDGPVRTLVGGILGRVDDMVIVRGVNVYPSALDQLVREFPDIVEYRVTYDTSDVMAELSLEVEAPAATAAALSHRLHDALALRVPVTEVEIGSLPRFELKARRWRRR